MSSNIGHGSDDLGVDLNAVQVTVGTDILIVIVQQNGRIVEGREAKGRNS